MEVKNNETLHNEKYRFLYSPQNVDDDAPEY